MKEKKSKNKDVCQVFIFDQQKVDRAKKSMIGEIEVIELAETFKVLGDKTRTKILFSLAGDELCVCDIAQILGMSVSAVSHQLRILRNLKLVKYRSEGRMAFYSLDDDHIKSLFKMGLEHVKEKR